MQSLSMQETADYLETAVIEISHDVGHAVIHTGRSAAGSRFVLVNDMHGDTVLSESL